MSIPISSQTAPDGRGDGSTGHRAIDVAIVGAGAAGLSCAIEAAERGARVAIVDAGPAVGGTASVAGGGTCIAGSALQERLGIEDSADLALEDWIEWGGDSVDVEWAERYLRASRTELFERLASAGVRWIGVNTHEGNRVPRWHRPEGGGKRVIAALEQQARSLPNIEWHLDHRVRDLVRAGGRVTGLVATSGGRESEISAEAVVVASGGFNNNAQMVAEHAVLAASAERVLLGGGRGAQGDGHRMLTDIGASFVQLEAVWMYPYGTPDYLDPNGERGLAIRNVDGDLWINDAGVRFHDETLRGGASGTKMLLQQPNGRCWSVFDAGVASRMVIADPFYTRDAQPIRERVEEFLNVSPYVRSAATVTELAGRMGVDPKSMRAAVDDMNAALSAGLDRDPAFDKPLAGLPAIQDGPFFAVRMYPMARKNLGGVRTDLECRVIGADERPIPGLFAAGEVAGMAGGHINGTAALEGTAFGPSVFSGMVAGRAAAD